MVSSHADLIRCALDFDKNSYVTDKHHQETEEVDAKKKDNWKNPGVLASELYLLGLNNG